MVVFCAMWDDEAEEEDDGEIGQAIDSEPVDEPHSDSSQFDEFLADSRWFEQRNDLASIHDTSQRSH